MAKSTKPKGKKKEYKKLKTPVFRLSYPHLFEAVESDFGGKFFDCVGIFDPAKFSAKDKPLWKAIGAALNEASIEAFGKPWKELPKHYRPGLRDGKERDGQDGYPAGSKFCTMKTTSRPGVVYWDKEEEAHKPISKEEGNTDMLYPGCYCQATVHIYAFTKKGNTGLGFGLDNLKFIKDGPRLDSRTKAEDDFDDDADAEWMDDAEEGGDDNGGDEEPSDPFAD